MPCNSDYLEPTSKERALQHTAALLCYVHRRLDRPVPDWIAAQAGQIYASDERLVPTLCELLKALPDDTREQIIYNAHDHWARALADWWETHLAADAARLTREADEAAKQALMAQARRKLTPEEQAALGIPQAAESLSRSRT